MKARSAPWPGAIAVSGGGDSLALMFLAVDWARTHAHPDPVILTVDHGLRAESANDSELVVQKARSVGLESHRLYWGGAKPASDLEAAARQARYRLMGEWCRVHNVGALYVAHTRDDQAETFLLRLARGSGVDGLSAMAPLSAFPSPGCEDLRVVRPLLGISRTALRRWLEARGETWVEDVMNCDPRFARARLRAVWPVLASVGLSADRIADAASHLLRAREALELETTLLLETATWTRGGHVLVDARRLIEAPEEIALRAISRLVMDVSGNTYRPRFDRLLRLFKDIRSPGGLQKGRTLHGCKIAPSSRQDSVFGGATLAVVREPPRKSGAASLS